MGRVEGSMIYSSLQSTVPYETVSYCWGEASIRASILVNGRLMDVPASAEIVLSAIICDDKERVVWIDAVCINQDDINERGRQVSIMDNIYRRGTKNLVYLGTDDGTVGEALCNIREINKEIMKDTHGFRDLRSITYPESTGGIFRLSNLPLITPLRVNSLIRFYSRTWFL